MLSLLSKDRKDVENAAGMLASSFRNLEKGLVKIIEASSRLKIPNELGEEFVGLFTPLYEAATEGVNLHERLITFIALPSQEKDSQVDQLLMLGMEACAISHIICERMEPFVYLLRDKICTYVRGHDLGARELSMWLSMHKSYVIYLSERMAKMHSDKASTAALGVGAAIGSSLILWLALGFKMVSFITIVPLQVLTGCSITLAIILIFLASIARWTKKRTVSLDFNRKAIIKATITGCLNRSTLMYNETRAYYSNVFVRTSVVMHFLLSLNLMQLFVYKFELISVEVAVAAWITMFLFSILSSAVIKWAQLFPLPEEITFSGTARMAIKAICINYSIAALIVWMAASAANKTLRFALGSVDLLTENTAVGLQKLENNGKYQKTEKKYASINNNQDDQH